MVHLSREGQEEIFDHARQGYPAECCGIVTEGGSDTFRVYRCDNIQDRLHGKDPEAHPRSSRTAYRMDGLQVHRILAETEAAGGRVMAFYHSHIDCEAYFSKEDRDAATFFGEPAYPGVIYLVVSVVDREVRGQKGFQWEEGERGFVEVALEVDK